MKRVQNRERKYIKEVLDSEFRTSQMTNMTTRFERAFAEKFGMKYAISHVNGTATMHSALAAARVGPGDEVIVPALTMASTTLVVLYQSAIPVFADVDPDTYCISPKSIKESITKKTKAIIPVSVYGLSPDFDEIMKIASEYSLTVIEDDAECYLGYYKGRIVGSLGHMSSFSLQGSKHITSGEGGVVLTNDETLADKVRAFSVLGYDIVNAKQGKITKDVLQSPDYARHTSFGFKYKMPDLCTAVALGQLGHIEELVSMRQYCAKQFNNIATKCEWLSPQKVPQGCIHSYYTCAMRLSLRKVDFSWHDFRKKFMEFGGDGIYAAWRLTYNEPMWDTSDFRIKNVTEPFAGRFRDYYRSRCHNAEEVQPELLLFKTNYLDKKRLKVQTDVLAKTIKYFSK